MERKAGAVLAPPLSPTTLHQASERPNPVHDPAQVVLIRESAFRTTTQITDPEIGNKGRRDDVPKYDVLLTDDAAVSKAAFLAGNQHVSIAFDDQVSVWHDVHDRGRQLVGECAVLLQLRIPRERAVGSHG